MRMLRMTLPVGAVAMIVIAPTAAAGQPLRPAPVVPAAAVSGRFGGAATTMVKNRARMFGSTAPHAGTLYFAVTDADLRGRSAADVLRRLSPPEIVSGHGLRRVEVVVELRHPLAIRAPQGQSVDIGTTKLYGAALRNSIEVRASIFASSVTVRTK